MHDCHPYSPAISITAPLKPLLVFSMTTLNYNCVRFVVVVVVVWGGVVVVVLFCMVCGCAQKDIQTVTCNSDM